MWTEEVAVIEVLEQHKFPRFEARHYADRIMRFVKAAIARDRKVTREMTCPEQVFHMQYDKLLGGLRQCSRSAGLGHSKCWEAKWRMIHFLTWYGRSHRLLSSHQPDDACVSPEHMRHFICVTREAVQEGKLRFSGGNSAYAAAIRL